jgi:hypothetical protein
MVEFADDGFLVTIPTHSDGANDEGMPCRGEGDATFAGKP